MYEHMLGHVKEILQHRDADATKIGTVPFRRRSEHAYRVYVWACRLLEGNTSIDHEAVKISAIFHDSGYANGNNGADHARYSSEICRQYLGHHGYSEQRIQGICYLITHHSKKEWLKEQTGSHELITLMEADLLDETGALSIVWDCMIEGGSQEQRFEKTYEHIQRYSGGILRNNPMVTEKAKYFWEKKQQLVSLFLEHLAMDLYE